MRDKLPKKTTAEQGEILLYQTEDSWHTIAEESRKAGKKGYKQKTLL